MSALFTRASTAARTVDCVVERLSGIVVGKEREEVHCAAAAHRVDAVDEDLRRVELRASSTLAARLHAATHAGSRLEKAGDGASELVPVHLRRRRVELNRVPVTPWRRHRVSVAPARAKLAARCGNRARTQPGMRRRWSRGRARTRRCQTSRHRRPTTCWASCRLPSSCRVPARTRRQRARSAPKARRCAP